MLHVHLSCLQLLHEVGTIYVLVLLVSCSVMSDSLKPHVLQPARPLCPWDSPGKNTGVGSHALLQGIYLIQGIKPASHMSPALQAGSLPLAPPGKHLK